MNILENMKMEKNVHPSVNETLNSEKVLYRLIFLLSE